MRLHKTEKGRYVIYGKDYKWLFRIEVSNTDNFGFGWKIRKEEQDLSLSLYCWRLFSVWLTLESKRFNYRSDPTGTGIVWQTKEHVLFVQLLDQTEMDSSKPALIHWYWNYRDWVFGRSIYSESQRNAKLGMVTKGVMKMPEGDYEMTLEYYTSYWHRPRSPFTRKLERVEITPKKPVPIPGKGENSWDLDEDATYSSTMPVNGRTPEELIADFKQSNMARRNRYGGNNWLPKKGAAMTNQDPNQRVDELLYQTIQFTELGNFPEAVPQHRNWVNVMGKVYSFDFTLAKQKLEQYIAQEVEAARIDDARELLRFSHDNPVNAETVKQYSVERLAQLTTTKGKE